MARRSWPPAASALLVMLVMLALMALMALLSRAPPTVDAWRPARIRPRS